MKAIEKRFGGNAATKKTQRNLLKQSYENFAASSSEVLDRSFDGLQKLISQVEIHGESISQEDVNQKFLRNLPLEWNTHTIVWRNKLEVETLSMDDLYNNLEIYEPELSDDVICAFLTSQPNSSQLVNKDLEQIYPDNLEEIYLKWKMAMLTMRERRFLKKTSKKLTVKGNKIIGFDKSNVKCYNCHKRGHFASKCRAPRHQDNKQKESTKRNVHVEIPASTALVSCDGLGGYDWSDQVEEEEFENKHIISEHNVKKSVVKTSEAKTSADKPKVVKKNFGPPNIKDWISDSEEEAESKPKIKKNTIKSNFAKIEFVKSKEQVKSPRKTIVKQGDQNRQNTHKPRGNQRNWNNMMSQRLRSNFEMINKACYGNPHQDLPNKGVINSGCSRHMIEDMSYLTDYEEIDRGYVAFRGNPKGGKIIGRGTINTGKLDFENVYFVKELKFNLFSISQMCDNKNNVLFTNTECIVLSPNFKLTDESHILLKAPRKNNMYSVDLKNIVPKGDLTCLFAKATSDESNLWHRRLAHLNFKTMNKLVSGNLVRAERRNRTLIEAARTMLADSKLPTTFWAKGVNTACYVQNRVLVVKPHTKTPYELFIGRTPTLSFMRPFGCPVTILNTKDHLGKFDDKADEGFFVRYSINSKAFRVFNSRTRIVKENLHIRFSENTPNVAGSGPAWLFDIDALTKSMNYKPVVAGNQSNGNVGTKACNDASKARMETVPGKDYILLPFTIGVSVVSANLNNDLPFDPEMPALKDISTFNFSSDHEDDDEQADMNNLDTIIQVSPVPTTRIHKDHPIDQVIGDLHSTTQTRNMLENLTQKGNSCIKRSKLDRGYAGRASTIQNTRSLDFEVKNASTPIETQKPLLKDEDGEEVYVHIYRSMIGSLMYLTSSRPDIMFAVCACARYQVNPKVSHLYAVKRIFSMVKHLDNVNKFLMYPRVGKEFFVRETPLFPIMMEQAQEEIGVNTPRSGEDSLKLIELMELCTILHSRVFALETTKTTQALEIKSLKRRVKKLEKTKKSRTHKLKTLYKVGLSVRVESSDDNEDLDLQGEEVIVKQEVVADKETIDEITLAKALKALKTLKPKIRGIIISDHEEPSKSRTITIVSSQQPSQIKVQDKGKGLMVEPEPMKKLSKKDQISLNDELAFKLQAEQEEKEERLAREKAQRIEEVNIAWDDVQDKIDDDFELAQRLQAEEQEQLTNTEKAKLFMKFLEKRRKLFAAKRTNEKRNRPTTKAQQRSLMCTYLKNMDGWKPKALKNKSFAEIQELFDKAMKRINNFIDFKTKLVEESLKKVKPEITQEESLKKVKAEITQEESSKRAGDELEQES
uniref:Ribonuclease H-like domain-containing protein n=1 Tax=Tanacetum cinerariifolium TaxID=118510 RepID=A0A699GSY4_TANCI|nr:ribonuclease H-like domain-containing protein [Tanacetum cinerariifolium]